MNQCTSDMTSGSNSCRATGSEPQARRSATGSTLRKMAWNCVGCTAKSCASRLRGLQLCAWTELHSRDKIKPHFLPSMGITRTGASATCVLAGRLLSVIECGLFQTSALGRVPTCGHWSQPSTVWWHAKTRRKPRALPARGSSPPSQQPAERAASTSLAAKPLASPAPCSPFIVLSLRLPLCCDA